MPRPFFDALYLSFTLVAGINPMIGMLMIPKTLAYVWVIVMCLKLYLKQKSPAQ